MKIKKQPAERRRKKEINSETVFCDITTLVRTPCCKILESISDGVFTIDADKRIISFNPAAEAITGFKAVEAVGQYCFDIFRANICEKNCALNQTLADGEPQINLPAKIINKKGDPKSIRLSTAILKNETGQVIGSLSSKLTILPLAGK